VSIYLESSKQKRQFIQAAIPLAIATCNLKIENEIYTNFPSFFSFFICIVMYEMYIMFPTVISRETESEMYAVNRNAIQIFLYMQLFLFFVISKCNKK